MDKLISEKGIAHILVILILLAGIIGGVFLVQRTQIFKPKASPQEVFLSFQPAQIEAEANRQYNLDVVLGSTGGNFRITGAQIHISFDSNQVEVRDIKAGPMLPVVLQAGQIESGEVRITLGAEPETALNSAGLIATLTVVPRANFTSTVIRLREQTIVTSLGFSGNVANSFGQSTIALSQPTEVTCTCDTPGGVAPNNHFTCSDGTNDRFCSSNEKCTNTSIRPAWPCENIVVPPPYETPYTTPYSYPTPAIVACPASSSLLTNGCFNELSGWDCPGPGSGGSCTIDSGTVKVHNRYGTIAGWGQQVSQGGLSATEREELCLSARVKKSNAGDDIGIAIQKASSPWNQHEIRSSASTTDWQTVKGTLKADGWDPSNLAIYLRVYSVSAVWFDDVSLIRGACQ